MATWSDADKEKLRQAILALATGEAVIRVQYDGPPRREAEYHPMDLTKMRSLLASMEASSPSATRRRYAKHSKGFNG
jgi:hypothetical protein